MNNNQTTPDYSLIFNDFPYFWLFQILGKKSSEIEKILGYKYSDEIIHRDEMAILK